MSWPKPKYSRSKVNGAGKVLIQEPVDVAEWSNATEVLNNWRSCHGYPINTFQATLRDKLASIDESAIVAQRLKRTPSIISKLRRFEKMQLSRMQDIGGLRAVVKTLKLVRALEDNYLTSRFHHALVAERDYIENPKVSGYRGIHLIYRYHNDKAPDYNGLLIELQIRNKLQHSWATAVETMGTFLNHSLKSSEGPERWLKFFSLAGSAFAYLENCNLVPGYEHLSEEETYMSLFHEVEYLDVKNNLQAYTVAMDAITSDERAGSYHLVVLNPVEQTVSIRSFGRARLEEANKKYTEIESKIIDGEQLQAVLVSTVSIESLRRAYPNYFLDTKEFIRQLERIERKL